MNVRKFSREVKPGLSREIFEKYSNIKFSENPFVGSPVFP
jgi:hypothetical protein